MFARAIILVLLIRSLLKGPVANLFACWLKNLQDILLPKRRVLFGYSKSPRKMEERQRVALVQAAFGQ